MLFESLQDRTGGKKTNAAVPEEAARLGHLRGLFRIRLFDETYEIVRRWRPAVHGVGQFQIAISGFRPLRYDPERDQASGTGRTGPYRDSVPKSFGILDDMIGRRKKKKRIGALLPDRQSGGENGGRGVAGNRFNQDPARFPLHLGQLLTGDKPEILIGYDDGRREIRTAEALDRFLKETALTKDSVELLWIAPP